MGTCLNATKKSREAAGNDSQIVDCDSPTVLTASLRRAPTARRLLFAKTPSVSAIPIEARHAVVIQRQKTSYEANFIKGYLESTPVFKFLPNETMEVIIEKMTLYSLLENEVIFQQGDIASVFFLIEKGSVEIRVNDQRRDVLGVGCMFGESGILHDSERTSTAITLTMTSLWGIDQDSFRLVLKLINEKYYNESKVFMNNIVWFKALTFNQKEAILQIVYHSEYVDGENILTEGDPGDSLLILKEGEVAYSIRGKTI